MPIYNFYILLIAKKNCSFSALSKQIFNLTFVKWSFCWHSGLRCVSYYFAACFLCGSTNLRLAKLVFTSSSNKVCAAAATAATDVGDLLRLHWLFLFPTKRWYLGFNYAFLSLSVCTFAGKFSNERSLFRFWSLFWDSMVTLWAIFKQVF